MNIATVRSCRGWELRKGIEGFAHQMQAHLGLPRIRVCWAQIGTACISASGDMTLAAVADDAVIDRRRIVRYVGFVLHELLHRAYSRFDINGDTAYLRQLHNAVEDVWIERRAIKAGITGNMRGVLADLIGQMVDEARASVHDWSDPAQYPFALAVTARGYGPTVPLAAGLAPIFAEASLRIDNCTSSADTLAVAQWVLDQINAAADSGDEDGEDGGSGDSGEAGDSGDESGEAGESGDSGDESGDGGDSGEAGDDGAGAGRSASGDAGETANKVRRPGRDAASVDPTIESDGTGEYWDEDRVISEPGAHVHSTKFRTILNINASARLRAEVRRLFDNTGHEQTSRNRLAGSINVHALPRHSVSDRLFQQRRDIEGVDSAAVLCLDVSGSMMSMLADVCSIGHLFWETLHTANVAVSIVTFGSRASIALPFNSTRAKARDVCERIMLGGGTNDYAAVRLSSDMLLTRAEPRKVIIVVTDGNGDPIACRKQIASAERMGITVIGIGLRHNVSSVYTNSVRVNSVAELGNTLFDKVRLAA